MGRPALGAQDLHLVFDSEARFCKVFEAGGEQLFGCAMRDAATAGPGFGHDGRCPRGEFEIVKPVVMCEPSFGHWFLPVEDYGDNRSMAEHGRGGIGIHGGGSGLPDPYLGEQGWVVTHGCLRVQNQDLERLRALVAGSQSKGGRVYLTVGGP